MVSKDELMHAINYAFQSPFVRKIVGVTVPEDQKRVDDETAEKIKASAHMMGSIKRKIQRSTFKPFRSILIISLPIAKKL